MKSNINRRREIFKDALPAQGTKEYSQLIEELKQRDESNPNIKKFIKKNWEKIIKSLEAQSLSHCDFITEKTLRHFLFEFNNRAWKFGLRSMATMFNILEAFFIFRKPEIYFELIEEENYLVSYFDFIDFITSKDFTDSKSLIEENVTSEIIYNFNVGKDLEDIKFKTDGTEFIVAGVSIIRRVNEVTVLVNCGKRETEKIKLTKEELSFDTDNPNKNALIDEFKKRMENVDFEYEYIDDAKKYITVVVACRIDLETMTIDARYIAEETNLTFQIVTDEIDGYLNEKGEFIKEEYQELYKHNLKRIEDFSAIFEAAKMSLYLPYYFNRNQSIIIEETLETKLKAQIINPITKRKFSNVLGFKCSLKSLYSLDTNNIFSPDIITLRDDLFKVKTNGYWKTIGLDEVGLDKKGNPIHGKTWVNQSLSWFEAKEEDLMIKKDKEPFAGNNSGYIYILRNPTMGENIFKIGRTGNLVDDRVSQLSKTSVPDKFYKSQEWNVKDCIKAEKEIHSTLNDYRVDPRREFFKIKYEKAIEVISGIVKRINGYSD